MGLRKKYGSQDDIPAELKSFYEERGGEWVLSLDDDDSGDLKQKVDEFRENNRKLFNENKELSDKLKNLDGLDPKKYQEAVKAMEELERMKEQNMIEAGKLDEVLAQRTETMRQSLEGKIDALTQQLESISAERDTYKGKLSTTLVDNTIQQAISEVGVPRKGAVSDLLARAKGIWTVDDDGNLVPKQNDKVVYGKDGENPLTPQEWAERQMVEAPYLFESNKGGGAGGSQGTPTGSQIVVAEGENISGIDPEDIMAGKTSVTFSE